MISELYVIVLALTLASLHMIAPDHWIPFSVLSSKRGYSLRKSLSISSGIGFGHGALSVLVSVLVAFTGLAFLSPEEIRIGAVFLLVAVSIYMVINAVREESGNENIENTSILVSVVPDPAFLPIALLAIVYGDFFLGILSLIFILTSGFALLLVVYVARGSIFRKLEKLKPTTVDYVVVAVLLLTALFVYFS